jgi:hypothetical protein
MWDFLRTTPAQAVIWVAVLLILVTMGIYVVRFVRSRGEIEGPSASGILTDFRGLQDGGHISQNEFKKIKSVLGDKLKAELNSEDAGETG